MSGQRSSQFHATPLHATLGDVVRQLRQVQSAVMVAAGALREQNADIDADVANLLRQAVSNPLHKQIVKLQSVRRLLASSSAFNGLPPAKRSKSSRPGREVKASVGTQRMPARNSSLSPDRDRTRRARRR